MEKLCKKGLIVLAHGSRNPKVPDEMNSLLVRLRKESQCLGFARTEAAFLELINPNLNEVARQLIADEIKKIVILPYFLMMGNHVSRDIPNQIEALSSEFPDVRFELLDYFGANPLISQWLCDHLSASMVKKG